MNTSACLNNHKTIASIHRLFFLLLVGIAISFTTTTAVYSETFNFSALSDARTFLADSNNPLVSFDSSGFDATRINEPTVSYANGQWLMAYSGLPFWNNFQAGLATSTDGETWTKYSSNPVIPWQQQPWANMRVMPRTIMYENGEYRMWLEGDNQNLYAYGQMGMATSPDGFNWTLLGTNPLFDGGGTYGIGFNEVVKLGDTYYGYYRPRLEGGFYVTTSSDGINWGAGQLIDQDLSLRTATTFTHDGVEYILSVLRNEDNLPVYGLSRDGINFEVDSTVISLSGTSNFVFSTLMVKDGQIYGWGHRGVGNVNWSYGNTVAELVTTDAPDWSLLVAVPEPGASTLLVSILIAQSLRCRQNRREIH